MSDAIETLPEIGTGLKEAEGGPPPAPTHGMDIQSLMALAIEKDGAIEVIERLAELRNQEMAREAEREFHAAFAEFKRRCPAIPRSKEGTKFKNDAGVTTGAVMYAPLEGIQYVVDPFLHELGLSYSWSNSATERSVKTDCVLRHVGGHSVTSSMVLPITGPPKSSATQASAGTRTFGKRLTLSDVLGISTSDDTDGAEPDYVDPISDEQFAILSEKVTGSGVEMRRFVKWLGVGSLKDLSQARYDEAINWLDARADA